MKLDRNLNGDGHGKYGLILNRKLAAMTGSARAEALVHLKQLEELGLIDWGTTLDTEFFVIRLRDINAGVALKAYANYADLGRNREYAADVHKLADRAGTLHPNAKAPD